MYSDSAGGVGGSESVSLTGLPGDATVANSVAPRAHFIFYKFIYLFIFGCVGS